MRINTLDGPAPLPRFHLPSPVPPPYALPFFVIMNFAREYISHIDSRDTSSTRVGSAGPNKDETSPYYGYVPYLPPTAVITGLFVISTRTPNVPLSPLFLAYLHLVVLHLGQAIRYKVHYMLLTAFVCGLFEVAGWSARIHSHFHPKQFRPWLIQLVFL